jgi:hypothetical protein
LANAFEPSSWAADRVGHPGDQRRLGPDHDEVGPQLDGQRGHGGRVGRGHLMQLRDLRDARIAGGGGEEVDGGVGG